MSLRIKKREKFYLKTLSLLLSLVFITETVTQAAPFSLSTPFPAPASLASFDIPHEFGSLIEMHLADNAQGGFPFIVHIQDAHGQFDAQQNIKKLIRYLEKEKGFKFAFVEGAASPLDGELFRIFPDQELNWKVAEELASKAEFSGVELFLLDSHSGFRVQGIEDANLYRENLNSFKKVYKNKAAIEHYLSTIDSQLAALLQKLPNRRLRIFLNAWRKFENGNQEYPLEDYLKLVAREAKDLLKIDLFDPALQKNWPYAERVVLIGKLERRMDRNGAEGERQRLLNLLKRSNADTELLRSFSNIGKRYANRTVGANQGVRHTLEKAYDAIGQKSFSYMRFPHFRNMSAAEIFQDELEAEPLYAEIRKLSDMILSALAKSAQEQELIRLFGESGLLRDFYNLELTRERFSAFQEKMITLTPKYLAKRLGELEVMPERKPVLSENLFKEAEHFYVVAARREKILLENMLNQLEASKESKAILITGGFHTEGIAEQLRERGIPYAVVAPRMKDVNARKFYTDAIADVRHSAKENYGFNRSAEASSNLSDIMKMATPWPSAYQALGGNPALVVEDTLDAVRTVTGERKISLKELQSMNPNSIFGSFRLGAQFGFGAAHKKAKVATDVSGLYSAKVLAQLKGAEISDTREAERRIAERRKQLGSEHVFEDEIGFTSRSELKTARLLECVACGMVGAGASWAGLMHVSRAIVAREGEEQTKKGIEHVFSRFRSGFKKRVMLSGAAAVIVVPKFNFQELTDFQKFHFMRNVFEDTKAVFSEGLAMVAPFGEAAVQGAETAQLMAVFFQALQYESHPDTVHLRNAIADGTERVLRSLGIDSVRKDIDLAWFLNPISVLRTKKVLRAYSDLTEKTLSKEISLKAKGFGARPSEKRALTVSAIAAYVLFRFLQSLEMPAYLAVPISIVSVWLISILTRLVVRAVFSRSDKDTSTGARRVGKNANSRHDQDSNPPRSVSGFGSRLGTQGISIRSISEFQAAIGNFIVQLADDSGLSWAEIKTQAGIGRKRNPKFIKDGIGLSDDDIARFAKVLFKRKSIVQEVARNSGMKGRVRSLRELNRRVALKFLELKGQRTIREMAKGSGLSLDTLEAISYGINLSDYAIGRISEFLGKDIFHEVIYDQAPPNFSKLDSIRVFRWKVGDEIRRRLDRKTANEIAGTKIRRKILRAMMSGRALTDERLKAIENLDTGSKSIVATVMKSAGARRTVDRMEDFYRRIGWTVHTLRMRRKIKEKRRTEFVAEKSGVGTTGVVSLLAHGLHLTDEHLKELELAFEGKNIVGEMLKDRSAPDFTTVESLKMFQWKLGDLLKQLRMKAQQKDAKRTAGKIAELLDVTPQDLSEAEGGARVSPFLLNAARIHLNGGRSLVADVMRAYGAELPVATLRDVELLIAAKAKELRGNHPRTEIARIAGLPESSYRALERAGQFISDKNLKAIAKAYKGKNILREIFENPPEEILLTQKLVEDAHSNKPGALSRLKSHYFSLAQKVASEVELEFDVGDKISWALDAVVYVAQQWTNSEILVDRIMPAAMKYAVEHRGHIPPFNQLDQMTAEPQARSGFGSQPNHDQKKLVKDFKVRGAILSPVVVKLPQIGDRPVRAVLVKRLDWDDFMVAKVRSRSGDQFQVFVDDELNRWYAVRLERKSKQAVVKLKASEDFNARREMLKTLRSRVSPSTEELERLLKTKTPDSLEKLILSTRLSGDYLAFDLNRSPDQEGIWIRAGNGEAEHIMSLSPSARRLRQQERIQPAYLQGAFGEVDDMLRHLWKRPDLRYYWLGFDDVRTQFTIHGVNVNQRLPKVTVSPNKAGKKFNTKRIADYVALNVHNELIEVGENGSHTEEELVEKFVNALALAEKRLGTFVNFYFDAVKPGVNGTGQEEFSVSDLVKKIILEAHRRGIHLASLKRVHYHLNSTRESGTIQIRVQKRVKQDAEKVRMRDVRRARFFWPGSDQNGGFRETAKLLGERKRYGIGIFRKPPNRQPVELDAALVHEMEGRNPKLIVLGSARSLDWAKKPIRRDMLEILLDQLLAGRHILILASQPDVEPNFINSLRFYLAGKSRDGFRPEDLERIWTSIHVYQDSGYAYGFWPDGSPRVYAQFKFEDLEQEANVSLRKTIRNKIMDLNKQTWKSRRLVVVERSGGFYVRAPKKDLSERKKFALSLKSALHREDLQIFVTADGIMISAGNRFSAVEKVMTDLGIKKNPEKVMIVSASVGEWEGSHEVIRRLPKAFAVYTGDSGAPQVVGETVIWSVNGEPGLYSVLEHITQTGFGYSQSMEDVLKVTYMLGEVSRVIRDVGFIKRFAPVTPSFLTHPDIEREKGKAKLSIELAESVMKDISQKSFSSNVSSQPKVFVLDFDAVSDRQAGQTLVSTLPRGSMVVVIMNGHSAQEFSEIYGNLFPRGGGVSLERFDGALNRNSVEKIFSHFSGAGRFAFAKRLLISSPHAALLKEDLSVKNLLAFEFDPKLRAFRRQALEIAAGYDFGEPLITPIGDLPLRFESIGLDSRVAYLTPYFLELTRLLFEAKAAQQFKQAA